MVHDFVNDASNRKQGGEANDCVMDGLGAESSGIVGERRRMSGGEKGYEGRQLRVGKHESRKED